MQFLVYILVYPLLWLISILPFKLLYLFSDFLYLVLFKIFGYRKKVVYENLDLVFPEKSEVEKHQIAKKFYHHLCDMIVEAIKSISISKKEILNRVSFPNLEVLKQLEDNNKNIALLCSHYGSWEWLFILQYHIGYKGYAVYKRLGNKYFDQLVRNIRAKYDSHLITTKETFKVLTNAKAQNQPVICGFVADQSPKLHKAIYWTTFMDIEVPVHVGHEVLAKRIDMSVVYLVAEKIGRGKYRVSFKLLAENPKEFPDYEITDKFLELAEKQIRKQPEYYLWTHKRWKHRR